MIRKRFINELILVLLLISFSTLGFSQDLLKGKDLSMIKVDEISIADFTKLKAQLNSAGMTSEQAEQMAISKGLPASEAAKLKNRLNSNQNRNKNGVDNKGTNLRENIDLDVNEIGKESKNGALINPLIFGAELYTNTSLSFEPNLKIATPINYVLGPEDEIAVTVYGVQEYFGNLQISPEGAVLIPNVGEVKLAGLTIEGATQKLKTIMGNSVYSYLKSGGAKLSVTLTKIRTISITIIGANRPGNYKVSSFASVFNALFVSGGPSGNGSFREIELIRNNKVLKKIDLYRFLLEGDQSDNIGLKDNDVIRIPVYKSRVEIQGQVKRPGIFEILPGESFSKIIEFASGFTDTAYKASVKVYQRTDKDREVKDLFIEEYTSFHPKSGDLYIVSKTLNKFKNSVKLTGAIYRPDTYELTEKLKISDLIKKADGLKQDAYLERGQIIRYQEDLTKSIVSFNVKKAIEGDEMNNFILQNDDEIIISSIQNLKDKFKVTIQGEIRIPGDYDFLSRLTLSDLIIQAGGFTDAAYKSIEIARLIKRDSLEIGDQRSSEIIKVVLGMSDLGKANSNIILKPYDVITIHRLAGYNLPVSVSISGQIQFPGPYTLENSNDRVSDLIKRAGGFTPNAFPEGAYLKRFKTESEKEQSKENAKNIQKNLIDSSSAILNEVLREYDKIPLDIYSLMKKPGSNEDIFLKEKDELFIPKYDAQVKISGEVLMATQMPYNSEFKFRDYINSAGGFTSYALRSKAYIVYANGSASATKRFLFIKKYPKILPGSELIIPKKRDKKSVSLTEIAGVTSILASLITAFVLVKNN